MDRRSFLSAGAATLGVPLLGARAFAHLERATEIAGAGSPAELAPANDYWDEIRAAFDLDPELINLNNGGVSPAPARVLEAMIEDLRASNRLPVMHMWRTLEPRIEDVRTALAEEFGCDREEMAITRNASEAQETMIFGIDLVRGDEVVLTTQNYPRMRNTWVQREMRDGVVLKWVRVPAPVPSDAEFVRLLFEAVTPRTRAIEVMHVNNQTGYIAPVAEIVRRARPLGIAVFVDGAHAFAQFPFTRETLGCDYYGTSLHKWLLAPVGTGFLYVRREKVEGLWPLMAGGPEQVKDIRKYEEIGTHPAANHNAILAAMAFHRGIGVERKAARLRWLRDRWIAPVAASAPDRVRVLSPTGEGAGCAIGTISIDGIDMAKFGSRLLEEKRIVTTPIVHDEYNALRVTPNVYTTADEVDLLAEALVREIRASRG